MGRGIGSAAITFLFLLWAGLVIYGVVDFRATEATGSGFTRGINKLGAFFRWEAAALGAGVLAWIVQRRAHTKGATKWLGRAPLLLSGGFFALVIAAYAFAVIYSRVFG